MNKIKISFSNISDSPTNFVGHEFYDAERRANRAAFLVNKTCLKANQTVVPKTYHGGRSEIVDMHNPIWGSVIGDAIITSKKMLGLTMNFADCPSLVLFDPLNEVLSLIHCGWKPLISGIIENTISKMIREMNVNPTNLESYIGPGICQKCYEVGPEVAEKFGYEPKKMNLSLISEIEKKLLIQGVLRKNMSNSSECTFHTENSNGKPKYYSWRRDKSDPLNANMFVCYIEN